MFFQNAVLRTVLTLIAYFSCAKRATPVTLQTPHRELFSVDSRKQGNEKMNPKLLQLMDAHDDAHALRKQLSQQYMRKLFNTPAHHDHGPVRKALEEAMEAEETARLALVNYENGLAMEGGK